MSRWPSNISQHRKTKPCCGFGSVFRWSFRRLHPERSTLREELGASPHACVAEAIVGSCAAVEQSVGAGTLDCVNRSKGCHDCCA